MQFLKSHYEKVILSIVLLGLAAAAALMPIKVSAEKEREDQRKSEIRNPKVKPLEPLVLTNALAAVARVEQKSRIKLSGDHNVFNPVRWQKRGGDGGIIKATDAGVNALKVTSITPLRWRVTFDNVQPSGIGSEVKYQLSVTKETEGAGRPVPRIAGLKDKNNMRGTPENPTELVVLLAGEKTPVTISKDKPFERVIGYAADLRYDPENNRTWKNVKNKAELAFGGETYNIVAITENEVTVSAKSNKKQTTIEFKPTQK
jgi:hypothetical protein